MVEQHGQGHDGRRRIGLALPCDVGSRTMHWLEHRRVRSRRIDISAGRQPDSSTDGSSDVGQDVAEQVVCDDNVESIGVGDEEHRRCIDVLVVRGHVIEF